MLTLSTNPGNTVKLAIQTLNSNGERADGYTTPQVDFIVGPDNLELSGFPTILTHLAIGVYFYDFVVPTGLLSLGSYLASITWLDIDTSTPQSELYLIQSGLPFGNVSAYPA